MCVCTVMSWGPSNTAPDSILVCEAISMAKPLSLMCELLSFERLCVCDCDCVHIVYVWHLSLVRVRECVCLCVCVCVCVCAQGVWFPSLRLCFLVPSELRSFLQQKHVLRSCVSFTLRWWESTAPLIVCGVLGQHTPDKFVCKWFYVCVCGVSCAQILKKLVLKSRIPPSFADLLSVSQHTNRQSWHLFARDQYDQGDLVWFTNHHPVCTCTA